MLLLDSYTQTIPKLNWITEWIIPIYVVAIFIILYIYTKESSFIVLLRKIASKLHFNFPKYIYITILLIILISILSINIAVPIILNYDYRYNHGKIYNENVKDPIRLQIEKAISVYARNEQLVRLDENIGSLFSSMDTINKLYCTNFQIFPLGFFEFEAYLFKNVPRLGQQGNGTNPPNVNYGAVGSNVIPPFSIYLNTQVDSIPKCLNYLKLDSLISDAYINTLCNKTVLTNLLIYYCGHVNRSIKSLQNDQQNSNDTTFNSALVFEKLLCRWLEALTMNNIKEIDSVLNNGLVSKLSLIKSLEKDYPGSDKIFFQKYTPDSVMYFKKIFEEDKKLAKRFLDILWGLHIYQFHGSWVIQDFLLEYNYDKIVQENLLSVFKVNHLEDKVHFFKHKTGFLYVYMINYKLPGISRHDIHKYKTLYTEKNHLTYNLFNTYGLSPNIFFLVFVLSVIWIIYFFNLSSINKYYKVNDKFRKLFVNYFWLVPLIGILLGLFAYIFPEINYDNNYFSKSIFNQFSLLISTSYYIQAILSNMQAQIALQLALVFLTIILILTWVYMEKLLNLLIAVVFFMTIYVLSNYILGEEIDNYDRMLFQGNLFLLSAFLIIVKSPYEYKKEEEKQIVESNMKLEVTKNLLITFTTITTHAAKRIIGQQYNYVVKVLDTPKRHPFYVFYTRCYILSILFQKEILSNQISLTKLKDNKIPTGNLTVKLLDLIMYHYVKNILYLDPELLYSLFDENIDVFDYSLFTPINDFISKQILNKDGERDDDPNSIIFNRFPSDRVMETFQKIEKIVLPCTMKGLEHLKFFVSDVLDDNLISITYFTSIFDEIFRNAFQSDSTNCQIIFKKSSQTLYLNFTINDMMSILQGIREYFKGENWKTPNEPILRAQGQGYSYGLFSIFQCCKGLNDSKVWIRIHNNQFQYKFIFNLPFIEQ